MDGSPYDLERLLGEGGMARVFLGIHRESGREAAIKVPKGGPLGTPRFLREIEVLQRLDHPHVMPILEIDRRRRWYAMPLADYSLADLYERSPFDWEQLRVVLSSLSGALMHSHANGFVHRDVSPVNLMRLRNGHWVLSDYGLVKATGLDEIRTSPKAKFGTPWFSAPEVHLQPASATAAADAWSVGALASWFTGIKVMAQDNSGLKALFSPLIDGTVRTDPSSRWTMSRITSYLNAELPAAVQVPVLANAAPDQCARCGARAGHDASCRCLGCGFLDFD
ncbi:MAG: protein kinase domain-containing protein [Solirubrobacterales bacterium]